MMLSPVLYTIETLPARTPPAANRLAGAVELFRSCFGKMLEYEPSATLYATEDVHLATAQNNGGLVVGALLSSIDQKSRSGHLHWAAIRSGFTKRGIGRQLVQITEVVMSAGGCTSISLALLDTPTATAFWRSQGYEQPHPPDTSPFAKTPPASPPTLVKRCPQFKAPELQ